MPGKPKPPRLPKAYAYQRPQRLDPAERIGLLKDNERLLIEYYEHYLKPNGVEWGECWADKFAVGRNANKRPNLAQIKYLSRPGDFLIVPDPTHLAPTMEDIEELVVWCRFHKLALHVIEPRLTFPNELSERIFAAMKFASRFDRQQATEVRNEKLKAWKYWNAKAPWGYVFFGEKDHRLLKYDRSKIRNGMRVLKISESGCKNLRETAEVAGISREQARRLCDGYLRFRKGFEDRRKFLVKEEQGVERDQLWEFLEANREVGS